MKVKIELWGEDETFSIQEVTESQYDLLKKIQKDFEDNARPYAPIMDIKILGL